MLVVGACALSRVSVVVKMSCYDVSRAEIVRLGEVYCWITCTADKTLKVDVP